MDNRLALFTFLIATLVAGCTSTPTRVNGLNPENSGVTSDIELNGVLISHGDKFVLGKAFQIPTVPHTDIPTPPGDFSVTFTKFPTGPWKFNGSTLFPEFNSESFDCADSGCNQYNQLKGPFINIECEKTFFYKMSSLTYSERLNLIELQNTAPEIDLTVGEAIGGAVGLGVIGTILIVAKGPDAAIVYSKNKLGACTDSKKTVWFDHDEFFDTVKKTILNDYGSINAYVTDIRQASKAANTLATINNDKRGEIETLIREWDTSLNKLLPHNVSKDNYRIRYNPYDLVEIPRKQDWDRKLAIIESDILSHYAKQHRSINRQMDSYNKSLKQIYGININLSAEVKSY